MAGTITSLVEIGETSRFEQQGWKMLRHGGHVSAVRDGYVRVVASRIGGDWFVLSWEYGEGTGEPAAEWKSEKYHAD